MKYVFLFFIFIFNLGETEYISGFRCGINFLASLKVVPVAVTLSKNQTLYFGNFLVNKYKPESSIDFAPCFFLRL